MKKVLTLLLAVCLSQLLCAQWSVTTLPDKRVAPAAAIAGNKAIFAGGYTQFSPSTVTSAKISIYDMDTQEWSAAELSQSRYGIAVASFEDKVMFTGGSLSFGASSKIDVYTPSTGAWTVQNMPTARGEMKAAVIGDKAYFVGGFGNNSDSTQLMLVYDNTADSWSTIMLPSIRHRPSVVVSGTKIYMAGGFDENFAVLKSVNVYDTQTGMWSLIQLPALRHGMSCFAKNGKVYFAGGYDNSDFPANSLFIYNEMDGTWNIKSWTSKRYGPGIGMLGDKIYIAGGTVNTSEVTSVEVFNTVTTSFEPMQQISQARYDITTLSAPDRLFFCSGYYPVSIINDAVSDVVDILTVAPSGTVEPEAYNPLTVTPSVTSGLISISFGEDRFDNIRLEINDLNGNLLKSAKSSGLQMPQQFAVNDLPAGTYLVRALANNQVFCKRFIKM